MVVESVGVGPTFEVAATISLAGASRKGAPVVGVHGHLILGVEADTLDDVDFAAVGPVGARHPEGRPDTTGSAGHMSEIQDDETMCVAGFGGESEGVAATT